MQFKSTASQEYLKFSLFFVFQKGGFDSIFYSVDPTHPMLVDATSLPDLEKFEVTSEHHKESEAWHVMDLNSCFHAKHFENGKKISKAVNEVLNIEF